METGLVKLNPQLMARLMDAGKMFTCKVVSVKPDPDWPRINVNIYMVD